MIEVIHDGLFALGVFLVALSILGTFDDEAPKMRSLVITIGALLIKQYL